MYDHTDVSTSYWKSDDQHCIKFPSCQHEKEQIVDVPDGAHSARLGIDFDISESIGKTILSRSNTTPRP